jgi:NitT/TauT family transport system permease protein
VNSKGIVLGLIGIGAFIIIWELYAISIDYPLFPRVMEILTQIVKSILDEDFMPNFLSTFSIAIRGISLAVVVGFVLGVAMGESNLILKILSPLINSFRGVSGISLFPILIVVFGIGDGSRIFVIFWTAVFPIIINTIAGLNDVNHEVVEAGQTEGASKIHILIHLKIPLALTTILNGIKIGMGTGWISLVVAEMLGASRGLGFMLTWSAASFQFAKSYSYIFIVSAILGVLTAGVEYIQKQAEYKLLN